MDLLSTSLKMNLMRFLVQWFLVGALNAMARHRPRGLGVVASPAMQAMLSSALPSSFDEEEVEGDELSWPW